jgi:signal transduction histidine kinase
VSNALELTPRGGHVQLDGERRGAVRDDGAGIPAPHHEAVFERFWPLRYSRART